MYSRIGALTALQYGCVLVPIVQLTTSRLGKSHQLSPNCFKAHNSTIALLIVFYCVEVASHLTTAPLSRGNILYTTILTFSWLGSAYQRLRCQKWLANTTVLFELPILILSDVGPSWASGPTIQLVCRIGRLAVLLFILRFVGCGQDKCKESSPYSDHQPVFSGQGAKEKRGSLPTSQPGRGRDTNSDSDSDDDDNNFDDELLAAERHTNRLREAGGWLCYLRSFSVFLPYIWPRNDVKVQLCIGICLLSITVRRALKIIIPLQYGIITNKLLDGAPVYRELLILLVLNILNENTGLGMVESLVKIPIKQFSERQVTNAAFSHVMSLSFDFHSEKDSAEIMKALEQGGALANVLATVVNEILPTIADLAIGLGLLYWKFNIYVAVLTMVSFTIYLVLEVVTSNWKIKSRRQLGKTERKRARVMHQAIQGWTTVSYFNTFGFEEQRFREALDAKMGADWEWNVRDVCIQALVDIMDPLAYFLLASMVVYGILHGWFQPGDLIFLTEYWAYLIWPLKWLSGDYRLMLSDLVDAERLLTLLQTEPTVVNKQDALEIDPVEGYVTFKDVSFAYDLRRVAINGLSFSVKPGETIAFVGATGAGKSTVTKLLCRFYDVSGGRVEIDGHDIRDITLNSLRSTVGVVPQDPMLFNDTIRGNLRYARPTATDEEIFEACKIAAIHDKILGFVDGYDTRVGERGVKLSGGEVQRLAVARVILKDPSVLILDEATSAIDTKTESDIQRALEVFKKGRQRATLVVAHRLSTIIEADRIVVLQDGRCIETGTHQELLGKGGKYRDLWNKQVGINS